MTELSRPTPRSRVMGTHSWIGEAGPLRVDDAYGSLDSVIRRMDSLLKRSKRRQVGEVDIFTRGNGTFRIDFKDPGRTQFAANTVAILKGFKSGERPMKRIEPFFDYLATTKG